MQLNTSAFSLLSSKCEVIPLGGNIWIPSVTHTQPPKPIKVFHYLPPAFTVQLCNHFELPLRSVAVMYAHYQRMNSVWLFHWVPSAREGNWHFIKWLSLRCPSAGKGGSFSLFYWPTPVRHWFSLVTQRGLGMPIRVEGVASHSQTSVPLLPYGQWEVRSVQVQPEKVHLSSQEMCSGDLRSWLEFHGCFTGRATFKSSEHMSTTSRALALDRLNTPATCTCTASQ